MAARRKNPIHLPKISMQTVGIAALVAIGAYAIYYAVKSPTAALPPAPSPSPAPVPSGGGGGAPLPPHP